MAENEKISLNEVEETKGFLFPHVSNFQVGNLSFEPASKFEVFCASF